MEKRDGEKQLWVRDLVRQHQTPLIRYARSIMGDSHAARDVVQDTFLQLCKKHPDDLAGHEAAWLFRVCHNSALNRIRKDRPMNHRPEVAQVAENVGDTRTADPAAVLVTQEQSRSVVQMIDALPENQQKVIRLRFHSGLSYREISVSTGLSVSNVGFLLHTALGTLRERFQG